MTINKTKLTKSIWMCLALACVLLQACEDTTNALLDDADFSAAEQEVLISEMEETCGMYGYFEFEEELRGPGCSDWQQKLPECAVVTESGIAYPKTITIVFDEGCEEKHGSVGSGKMTMVISEDIKTEGATRTISFERLDRDHNTVTGTQVLTNMGVTSAGHHLFSRTMRIEGVGEKGVFSSTYSGEVEWVSGFDTKDCYDNMVLISGSSRTSKNGEVVGEREITKPVLRTFNCQYPVSGIIQIAGLKGSTQVDFGTGSCDSKAVATRNEISNEIDLDKRMVFQGNERPRK